MREFTTSIRTVTAAAVLAVAGFATTAWAGEPPPPPPPPPHAMGQMGHPPMHCGGGMMGHGMHGMMGNRGAGMMRGMHGRMDQRLSRLHDDLHLNDNQAEAWQTYKKALRTQIHALAQHHRMGQGMMGQQGERQTAPELLDRRVQAMQARLQAMQSLAKATHDFYNQLSPTQKTIFDLEVGQHYGHGHRWR